MVHIADPRSSTTWSVEPLVLTEEERAELEWRARPDDAASRLRAPQVVLLAANGVRGRKIATQVGLAPQAVSKWRIRFRDLGHSGLEDAERSGRPLVYGPTDRLLLMAKVTSPSSPRSGADASSTRP